MESAECVVGSEPGEVMVETGKVLSDWLAGLATLGRHQPEHLDSRSQYGIQGGVAQVRIVVVREKHAAAEPERIDGSRQFAKRTLDIG